jgi:hypothetical protein
MSQSTGVRNERHQAFLAEAGFGPTADGLGANVGRLLDAIHRHSWLHPLRWGAIGNWSAVWSGREPLGHHRAVLADLGVARPIVGTVSFTETADLSAGDLVHRPASVYRAGRLEMLPLTTPVGVDDWLDLSPGVPRFVPWMWGVVDGKPVHLARLHAAPTRTQAPVPLVFEAELLWGNEKRVRQWLARLWRHLPEGDLGPLFARGVRRDGTATPLKVRHSKPVFELSTDDGRHWSVVGDADDLTRLCLLPYQVVASSSPEGLVRSAPEVVPLLSQRLVKALLGYVGACGEPGAPPIFVEWAAPARGRPGERAGSSVTATLARANALPPLDFITLPMTPVLLLPSTAAPADARAIGLFLEALRARTGPSLQRGAMEAARAAYLETRPRVSALYRSRFGGPVPLEQPGYARAVDLPEVRALSLAQAGMAVATLLDAWRKP